MRWLLPVVAALVIIASGSHVAAQADPAAKLRAGIQAAGGKIQPYRRSPREKENPNESMVLLGGEKITDDLVLKLKDLKAALPRLLHTNPEV